MSRWRQAQARTRAAALGCIWQGEGCWLCLSRCCFFAPLLLLPRKFPPGQGRRGGCQRQGARPLRALPCALGLAARLRGDAVGLGRQRQDRAAPEVGVGQGWGRLPTRDECRGAVPLCLVSAAGCPAVVWTHPGGGVGARVPWGKSRPLGRAPGSRARTLSYPQGGGGDRRAEPRVSFQGTAQPAAALGDSVLAPADQARHGVGPPQPPQPYLSPKSRPPRARQSQGWAIPGQLHTTVTGCPAQPPTGTARRGWGAAPSPSVPGCPLPVQLQPRCPPGLGCSQFANGSANIPAAGTRGWGEPSLQHIPGRQRHPSSRC